MAAAAKAYEIGGTIYEQRELVYGQVLQLVDVLGDVEFSAGLDYRSLMSALGDKLIPAIAVVLTEKGTSPRDKDLEALTKELEFSIPAGMIPDIVADFFDLTPVVKLIEALAGGMKAAALIESKYQTSEKESSDSSSRSAEETLQSAT